nr:hypothetical protein [Campylobacter lari]MCR6518119.1 hypothetical protein [Campylobacter lari]
MEPLCRSILVVLLFLSLMIDSLLIPFWPPWMSELPLSVIPLIAVGLLSSLLF